MPYEFSPQERIANILFAIKEIDILLHEADTSLASMYRQQLERLFISLNEAIFDMKVTK